MVLGTLLTAQTAPTYKIAGTLVSATEGHPLGRARVSILDTRNRRPVQSMITADDGHFEFTDVPAGKFALRGEKRGYLAAAYDEHEQFSTAIVTGAGLDTEHLILRIAPLASIYGQVLDEHGDPVRRARVILWRDDHSTGIGRTVRFNQDQTDDIGAYEFAPIAPGTYFISVSAEPWYAIHPPSATANKVQDVDRSLDVVYPTTYYAGATESEDATPILLRGGDRLQLDLHLLPVPALHVIYRTNASPNGYTSPTLFKRVFDDLDVPDRQPAQVIEPGVFELTTAPGRYHVTIPGNGKSPERAAEVEIAEDNQELDLASGDLLSTVTAAVEIQAEANLPQPLYVALRDAKGSIASRQVVDEQGNVTFAQIAPGKYTVLAGSSGTPYSVLGIAPDPAPGTPRVKPVPGHTLDVPPGASLSVALTLVSGSTLVEGFVKHDGKPVAGAMVVLVPANPDARRELFRRDQSDLDGSFAFRNVVPGAYTVVAIEDGWALDWSQPVVIGRYAVHGTHATIPPGSKSYRLPTAVDSQIK